MCIISQKRSKIKAVVLYIIKPQKLYVPLRRDDIQPKGLMRYTQ